MSLRHVRALIPRLGGAARSTFHKGEHGKVGVVGGCFEYTGAPFYAAISSLKCGADLSHIFCSPAAAIPIKSYSPEIIVHPVMPELSSSTESAEDRVAAAVAEVVASFPRLHTLVIGPGLGRDTLMLDATSAIILAAREHNLPLVVDADGLFLLSQRPELIRGYNKAILTPNAAELRRLWLAVFPDSTPFPGIGPSLVDAGNSPLKKCTPEHGRVIHPAEDSSPEHCSAAYQIAMALGHPTILQKGPDDIISDGRVEVVCSASGSPR